MASHINKNHTGKVFRTYKEIKLGYLYGSAVRGDSVSSSDIDILGVVDSIKDLDYGKLYSELQKGVKGDLDLKIIIPQETSPVFMFNVISEGEVIYSTSEKERISFEVYVMKKYYDTQHIRDIYDSYLINRLENDQFAKT